MPGKSPVKGIARVKETLLFQGRSGSVFVFIFQTIRNFVLQSCHKSVVFFGISIYIYAKDHFPPHFHAIYGNDEAMIDIKSKSIINGNLPNRAFKMVKEWAELHERELLNNFDESQKPNPRFKLIEPLK